MTWRIREKPVGGLPNGWRQVTELEARRFAEAGGFEVEHITEGDAMATAKELDLAAENLRLREQIEHLQTALVDAMQQLELLKRENELAVGYLEKAKERRATAPRKATTKSAKKRRRAA